MDNLQYLELIKDNKIKLLKSFKPYYKWIIFNIKDITLLASNVTFMVLNLIING